MSTRTAIRSTLALIATLVLCAAANAQLFRAYLAPGPAGSDANPCTLPLPCRLLPAALAAVADGGEIWMLDSANYNTATVTIGKSVSILAVPGSIGSVVATGGPAISITSDSLKVALRNLVIVPLPASGATHGISMTGASSLIIEDSVIANLPNSGVSVSGAGTVKIATTTLRNNGASGGSAVSAQEGARVDISGAKMLANDASVLSQSSTANTTTVIVSDSIISGSFQGVYAVALIAGGSARVFVTRCTIEGNTDGLHSSTTGVGSAVVTVSQSMITNNTNAWSQSGTGSVIKSLGNNHIQDNIGSFGTLTPVALQ
jgi:hypothetical protein